MRNVEQRRDIAIFASLFSIVVLAGLGHYALWDDEANTALFAQSVWQHGFPRASLGDNIIAFRHGVELTDGINRFMPPLAYYVAAPFVGFFGHSATTVRLPFALIGIAGVVAAFAHVRRFGSRRLAFLFGTGLLCNVSLMLYIKQARYYSLVITFTILACLAYLRRNGKGNLTLLSLCSCLLLLTHYLAYAALVTCLLFDYLCWGRHEQKLSLRAIAKYSILQVVVCFAVVFVMQPFGKSAAAPGDTEFWHGKLLLLAWTFRDMNRCEFGAMALVALTPLLFVLGKVDTLVLRLSAAACLYAVIICALSPQPMGTGYPAVADVRYMIATIPLFVVLTACLLNRIRSTWLQAAMAVLFFATNGLNFASGRLWGSPTYALQSTPLEYAEEVAQARKDPYSDVAAWLRSSAPANASVVSFPDHTIYPLMWHAPDQVYAWQLLPEQKAFFKTLPAIHFRGELAPDFLIGFGLGQHDVRAQVTALGQELGVHYEKIDFLPVHFPESYRPEYYWRVFRNPEVGPEGVDGVTIFRKLADVNLT